MNIGYIGQGIMDKPMAQSAPYSGHHASRYSILMPGERLFSAQLFTDVQSVHRGMRGELYFSRTHAVASTAVRRVDENRKRIY